VEKQAFIYQHAQVFLKWKRTNQNKELSPGIEENFKSFGIVNCKDILLDKFHPLCSCHSQEQNTLKILQRFFFSKKKIKRIQIK
jgi:hypothetical protein